MRKSDLIRSLAGQGLRVADIAKRADVGYRHAYNVLRAANLLPGRSADPKEPTGSVPLAQRRPLTVERLLAGGFEHAGDWMLSSGVLMPSRPLPKARGVYAFAREGQVLYVGLATKGLARRLYAFGRPGPTQTTNQRLGAVLREQIASGAVIAIYVALPPPLDWNGLPVAGDAGLELGLIENFDLPWNLRSARSEPGT